MRLPAVSALLLPARNGIRGCGDPNGASLPIWPHHDPKKDVIFEFKPDGSAGAGPDPRKARLDVTQLNTEAGKRSDF
jgi:para-nitrobenzyl esterase